MLLKLHVQTTACVHMRSTARTCVRTLMGTVTQHLTRKHLPHSSCRQYSSADKTQQSATTVLLAMSINVCMHASICLSRRPTRPEKSICMNLKGWQQHARGAA